jgi:hypothetical protein
MSIMKTTVDFYRFRKAFESMGRANNFPNRLPELFDWLEEIGAETCEEIELDVIALCCDFTEYENLSDFQRDYGDDYQSLDDIEYRTFVIGWFDEGSPFIIQNF